MNWQHAKVVVTGAGGFIGSHLVERRVELGAEVTAFVRYNSRNDAGLLEFLGDKRKAIRTVSGEIRELETVRRVTWIGLESAEHFEDAVRELQSAPRPKGESSGS